MGSCQGTEKRDCSALLKSTFVILLCGVMLICYGSAYAICGDMQWDALEDETLHDFKNNDCRFSFYDRTFRFNRNSIYEGHAYVVYYILLWCSVLILAVLAFLVLSCKCCLFLRRFLCFAFIIATCMLVVADVVSIGISFGHYEDAVDMIPIQRGKDNITSARNAYLGLNCAVLLMQTYILLNTAYDMASDDDKEDSAETAEQEMMKKNNQGVRGI